MQWISSVDDPKENRIQSKSPFEYVCLFGAPPTRRTYRMPTWNGSHINLIRLRILRIDFNGMRIKWGIKQRWNKTLQSTFTRRQKQQQWSNNQMEWSADYEHSQSVCGRLSSPLHNSIVAGGKFALSPVRRALLLSTLEKVSSAFTAEINSSLNSFGSPPQSGLCTSFSPTHMVREYRSSE